MKKDFLDDLIRALVNLQKAQKEISLPIPLSPVEVLREIDRVAKEHEISSEDLQTALAIRSVTTGDITVAEIDLLKDLEKSE